MDATIVSAKFKVRRPMLRSSSNEVSKGPASSVVKKSGGVGVVIPAAGLLAKSTSAPLRRVRKVLVAPPNDMASLSRLMSPLMSTITVLPLGLITLLAEVREKDGVNIRLLNRTMLVGSNLSTLMASE